MSILGSFFNRGFMASQCKTLLKLTIPRIKLLRNRREIQLKQMRRNIAKLLETGQEATARIRVEHIIREENMIAAQEIIELFCELIVVRLPIIESQRECPLDLKEAISSICFTAPRCADLPELLQVQLLFASKYGKEFVSAATELMPDCGVNRQLVELLSVHPPPPDKRLNLLKEIAAEHEIDWDPAASETELFKKQEDLLNGPTQISSESKLILPDEKHNEESHSATKQPNQEKPDSETAPSQPNQEHADSDSDTSEFPNVTQVPVLSNVNITTDPEMATPPGFPHHEIEYHSSSHFGVTEDVKQKQVEERSVIYKDESQTPGRTDNKQFVPFTSPPLASPESFSTRHSDSPPSLEKKKSEDDVDLQDVLDAAHAAAETAECAAAAARSAASLAEIHINELTKKSTEHKPDSTSENPFYAGSSHQSTTTERGSFNEQNTATDYGGNSMYEPESRKDSNAAQSAASYEQAHVIDLTKKNSLCEPDDTSENPFYTGSYHQSATTERGHFNEQNTVGDYDGNFMNKLESHHDYNAAQSAASLEQVHICDLKKKNSSCEPDDTSENPFYTNSANRSTAEGGHFAEKNTAGDYDDYHGTNELGTRQANSTPTGLQSPSSPSYDTIKEDSDSSLPNYETLDDKSSTSFRHRSLPSMEDDLYSSYINLFTFPNSNKGSQAGSDNHHSYS
ncbi:hypothetical protein QN277_010856 [Acacia crassicarpa]|uniref:IST1-like protein n=1 Tax=Acacia crassicarpa TaxID=499986 RepID=A0AAE1IPN2_9FABA|nr:hypothetical protein QN277_010856 [Acacia crassicarpa]